MVTTQRPDTTDSSPLARRPLRRVVRFNFGLAAGVWTVWAVVGGSRAFDAIAHNWRIALTMTFGSLVGGGTSEGGGAVSFPVLTKALHVAAPDARLFSFFIQGVGMTAAALSIRYSRRRVDARVIGHCVPMGIVGAVVSVLLVAPHVSSAQVRIAFSTALAGMAIVLIATNRRGEDAAHQSLPAVLGRRERGILLAVGFAGGLLSGVLGVGENIIAFAVIVLLFRVSARVATPTTVVMMACVSIVCSLLHVLVLRDVPTVVVNYWLAAVPVVVVGAPLGALIASRMSSRAIRLVLVALIAADTVSTALLVPISQTAWIVAAGVLVTVVSGCTMLARSTRYAVTVGDGRA